MTDLKSWLIAKVRKDLKAMPNEELVKWHGETESATLKVVIKEELERRY
jgi:hypothetical protein